MADETKQSPRPESSTIRRAGRADQSFISEMQYEAFFVPPGEDGEYTAVMLHTGVEP